MYKRSWLRIVLLSFSCLFFCPSLLLFVPLFYQCYENVPELLKSLGAGFGFLLLLLLNSDMKLDWMLKMDGNGSKSNRSFTFRCLNSYMVWKVFVDMFVEIGKIFSFVHSGFWPYFCCCSYVILYDFNQMRMPQDCVKKINDFMVTRMVWNFFFILWKEQRHVCWQSSQWWRKFVLFLFFLLEFIN